jgi:tetratricopeptide (TPR) repeat protein
MIFREADTIRQRLAAKHKERKRMPTSNTLTLWHIPYQRNPYFTGREDVLSQLHRTLHAENTVALSHPQGISGLGGIGKTQTALEYAYRHRAEYDAVFWVRADSVTALTSSLVELARALKLPERYEQDQEIIIQAVLRWFRLHTNWLLIYDNIDDLSIAESFLPKAGAGHLLFTTRAYALSGLAQRLDIQKMEPEIGALLILRRASLLALEAALNMANPDDQSTAHAISQELDGLPLALDQAGAYVKEAPCPLSDYLYHYQTRRSDILRRRGQFDQDYPASVATTWSLSFEKVREANPASAELLHFCAFLAPDAIPEAIVIQGAAHLPPTLQDAVVHPVQFDRATATLLAYSLLRRNANETLNVHRLVQMVLRDDMPGEVKHQWKQQAVLTVNTAGPNVEDLTQWNICEQWVPHALVCAIWIDEEHISSPEAIHLLNEAGYYLNKRARHGEAEPLYRRALSIREQELGSDHPDTATGLNNLASLYSMEGKYTEAEPLYWRALAIRERLLGANHPSTATSLNNLASLYKAQGKYSEAEQLVKRTLLIREEQLGADHPETALSVNNLAVLYDTQGKYVEAEPLYRRALAIRERQLGADHPDTASSLNNLAIFYKTQGKYTKAELLARRAHKIYEEQLGGDHPDTAMSLNNLAMLYNVQGKHAEAEPLVRRALEIYEKRLGVDHPDTLVIRENYGALLRILDNLS